MRLEEQIRRYTQMVDALAPPIDELVPTESLDRGDLDATQVEITIPLRPPRRRSGPGWVYALAVAAAVVLLAVPIWLFASSSSDVASTTAPLLPTTLDTFPPPSSDAFVYVDIADQNRTNGAGWAPEVPVRVSVEGAEFQSIGETTSDGSFELPFPFDVSAGGEVTVEVGGVPITSIVPEMTITEFDEVGDRVLGITDLPPEIAECCLSIFLFTSPADNQAEEFRMEIRDDGTWFADLAGQFDVTGSVHADIVFGDPNGLWLAWLNLAPEELSYSGPVLDPASGHYYEAVSVPGGISWDAARTAAENRTFQGLQGHLVSVTTEAENQFLVANLPRAFATGPDVLPYWLGGRQAPGSVEPGEGWEWVSGEAWSYENWGNGEPNNSVEGEECLHAHHDPMDETRWNDQPCNALIDGYIVEYLVES